MSGDKNSGTRIIAGAMSGTSADGVDIAIVAISGRGLEMSAKLLHHESLPYEAELRKLIFCIRSQGSTDLGNLAKLGREISLVYANAVKTALSRSNLTPKDLACIAAHGQTLYHAPPDTIQWFDPALVAAEVGCPVVSDFRRADCAAGGQGAPLVPFADYILFRHPTKNRILLNIGGIANITWLKAGGSIEEVIAFDTGPGNCISDYLCQKHDPAGPGYDADGALARQGSSHRPTVTAFVRTGFISRKPPKSTDGPAMIAAFEKSKRSGSFSGTFQDQLATACHCCIAGISLTLGQNTKRYFDGAPLEINVSGGGTNNHYLIGQLRHELGGLPLTILPMEPQLSQAKEAIAFALLAAATLDGIPSNVPSVTGAKRGVILGSITPKP